MVKDRDTRDGFAAADKVMPAHFVAAMARRGVDPQRRCRRATFLGYAPPLCLTREEADTIVSVTADSIAEVLG